MGQIYFLADGMPESHQGLMKKFYRKTYPHGAAILSEMKLYGMRFDERDRIYVEADLNHNFADTKYTNTGIDSGMKFKTNPFRKGRIKILLYFATTIIGWFFGFKGVKPLPQELAVKARGLMKKMDPTTLNNIHLVPLFTFKDNYYVDKRNKTEKEAV